jgi:hypothetical protein
MPTTRSIHTSCRGGACPAHAPFKASVQMRQSSRRVVIPSKARTSAPPGGLRQENLLFLCSTSHTASYSDGSGGSAGTVEGFGGTVGLDGVTGLEADAGLLSKVALPTVKYLRIFSRRFGPIPRIARKSSTLLNAPYDLRICKILSAVTGPIPGTCCSSSDVAVFKLMGAGGGFLFASRLRGNAHSTANRQSRGATSRRMAG